MRQCLAGEHGAWESIVHQHPQRIYNLVYRYTGRFDEAEDLAQEIFLKVYRTLGFVPAGIRSAGYVVDTGGAKPYHRPLPEVQD